MSKLIFIQRNIKGRGTRQKKQDLKDRKNIDRIPFIPFFIFSTDVIACFFSHHHIPEIYFKIILKLKVNIGISLQ